MDIFEKLNEKQTEAVRATEGNVRVIAGAGSGKTRLLVNRYAYLVKDYGIDSASILCVTFTNKAAGEMKSRIRALIGPEYDTSLICTYHGFCARLLRENPEKLFLTGNFQIIDTVQQKSILEEIYQKYELKLDYASFESILKKIGKVKANIDYVPRMCDPKERPILPKIETTDDRVIEEFMQRQKAVYALDFYDLLNFALYLLETNTEVRKKWQDRLNYIQVDEFQDSTRRELHLIDILSAKYGNLLIVGDPDQNIYEWRGSDVKLLVDFDKTHPQTQTIFLNRNYRSTPQILKCANALIDKNELRLKKDLFTLSPSGAAVLHYHSKTEEEENTIIADTVKKLKRENGYTYSDFAILYRSGFLSRTVEKKLVENGIPYEIYGGVKFYQRMEVLDLLAYLKLIAFDDNFSFKRVINTPRRKFGRAKLTALEQIKETELTLFSESENKSLFSVLKNHLNDRIFKASDASAFVSFIEKMRAFCAGARISEIVNRVAAESGYEQYIRELGDEERLENLAEFKRIADEFEKNFGERLSLTEFLNQIALQAGEDEEKPREAVKLMTIHSAKGLEFPVVFVVGFTEGIFPSSKTIEERKKLGLEEERRLCYVALTRAKSRLFLMDSEGFSQNGIKKLPSRFLREIGIKNYTRIGEISEELDRESRGYAARINRGLEASTEKNVGEMVEHHAFGHGIIVAKEERSGSYVVKFDKLTQTRSISKEYFSSFEKDPSENLPQHSPKRAPAAREKELKVFPETLENEVPEKSPKEAPDSGSEKFLHTHSPTQSILPPPEKTDESPLPAAKGEPEKEKGIQAAFPFSALAADVESNSTKAFPDNVDALLAGCSDTYKNTLQISGEGADPLKSRPSALTDCTENPVEKTTDMPVLNHSENPFTQRPTENPESGSSPCLDEDRPVHPHPEKSLNQSVLPDFEEEKQILVPKEPESAKNLPEKPRETIAAPDNLWKRQDVPHSGWRCVGVSDLGSPCGVCEMCGYQIIRYVHHMVHDCFRSLNVGCVCAGKMEGDIEAAKKREQEFKNRESRRENFKNRKWKNSRNGNPYLKVKNHVIVLCRRKSDCTWKFSLDGNFCAEIFPSREEAVNAVFEALEKATQGGTP